MSNTWTGGTKNTGTWRYIPKLGSGVLQFVMTQIQSYYTQEQQSFGSGTWTGGTKNTGNSWTGQTKH
jgi:hypothetical protein